MEVVLEATDKGARITARRGPSMAGLPQKVLLTLPRYGCCELRDELVIEARGNVKVDLSEGSKQFKKTGKASFTTTDVQAVWTFGPEMAPAVAFLNEDGPAATVFAEEYRVRVDWKGRQAAEERHRFAAVTFIKRGKVYHYLCDDLDLEQGDVAMVQTASGEKQVEVIRVFEATFDEMPLPKDSYKSLTIPKTVVIE